MSEPNAVSNELRSAEQEIDAEYLSNPLMKLPRGEAMWYLLAACEEYLMARVLTGTDPSDWFAASDNLNNFVRFPMRWINWSCPNGDCSIPPLINQDRYTASQALFRLSQSYEAFSLAYTYASHSLLTLQIEGDHHIRTDGPILREHRAMAYDYLTNTGANDPPSAVPIYNLIAPSVRVVGDRFDYPLTKRLVRAAAECVDTHQYSLPGEWRIADYTMREYWQVMSILHALSGIHVAARVAAANKGCRNRGYACAPVVAEESALVGRVANYASLHTETVRKVLADLTYGAGDMRTPDLALQPLVELAPGHFAWSPSMLSGLATERNLVTLLQRMPESQRAYSELSTQKESLMRDSICRDLAELDIRTWHGKVPGWTANEVDLVVISDSEKCALAIELKSFLMPAEPREVIQKSKEIATGIQQVRDRSAEDSSHLRKLLGLTDEYRLTWVVASETSVGGGWVHAADVPVVRASHLVARLVRDQSFGKVAKWLEDQEYWPVEGEHYSRERSPETVGRWTLDWYGIVPLADGYV